MKNSFLKNGNRKDGDVTTSMVELKTPTPGKIGQGKLAADGTCHIPQKILQ